MARRQRWTTGAVAAVAIEAIGAALVGLRFGLHGEAREVAWAGVAAMLAALPAVIITQQARATELREDERAAIHMTGYREALHHMAEGLLAPPDPSDPRPGSHEPSDNVVYLPRFTDDSQNRGTRQGGRAAR